MSSSGRFELIIGGMFSGKSTELIRRLNRYNAINKKILIINSSKDTRCSKSVLQTHDKLSIQCIKTDCLLKILMQQQFVDSDIIAIDEGQFFSHLRDFVEGALLSKKHIIVAGLDGDYKQQIFGEIVHLIPLADEVIKLTAFCMECNNGTLGPFSKRIVNNSEQELVGEADMYRAVCRTHLYSFL
jgi:thymidine kinase